MEAHTSAVPVAQDEIRILTTPQPNTKFYIHIESTPITPDQNTRWRDMGIFSLGVATTALVIYISRERSLVDTMKTIAVNKMPAQGKWFPFW